MEPINLVPGVGWILAKPDMYQQNTYILGTTCTAVSDHRSMQHAHNVSSACTDGTDNYACFSRRK